MNKLSQTGCLVAGNRIRGVLAFLIKQNSEYFCSDSEVEVQKFFLPTTKK